MAALIVNNVLSSSLQVSYNYAGTEELFGYNVEGTYVVDISDINLQEGDTVLTQGRDAIEDAYGRPNITARIGADDYINGKVQDFSFEAGALVGSETVSITISESRKLDSHSNSIFTKYIPNPHWIESFKESYDFSRNGADYTSTRNISLKYNQSAADTFITDAKVFLTNYYFVNRPSFGYQEDGISENALIKDNYRGDISETYDLIELSASLTESVNSSFVDSTKAVGRKETQQIEITEKGYINKTYNINLTSLRVDSERTLTSAIGEIVDELKSQEASEFGSPISISKGITKDGNNATLTIKFTTDPTNQDDYSSYSGSEAKEGKFTNFTLNIEYKGNGKNDHDKFINTKDVWVREQKLNQLRIQRLFHPTKPIYEKSRSTNFRKSEGMISESIVFTTDDSYKERDDGLLKLKKTLSKTHQIVRIEKVLDLSALKEGAVINSGGLLTVGQASVTASATATQTDGIYKVKESLEAATEELNEFIGEDKLYMQSDTISMTLGDGVAQRNLNYLFISET